MLEFREIALSDRERINKALRESDFMGCEYSFANNMAWRRLADSRIAFYKDFYICCAFDTDDKIPHFIYPSGSGDIREVIAEMKRVCEYLSCPLRLSGVTRSQLDILGELYPDAFDFELDRDGCDYIYSRSDLAELPGRKYHSKRNHIAQFGKRDFTYSPLTENDIDECICFTARGINGDAPDDRSALAEQFALNTYFTHFAELGLTGGIIRIDGKIAAVTIGERLNSDTFCVHIEKADRSFEGIYSAINNLFVKNAAEGFRYINREEDLGIEGLRRSKLSYRPAFLLEKHIVTFK